LRNHAPRERGKRRLSVARASEALMDEALEILEIADKVCTVVKRQ
jgi:thioredoxin reductase